VYFPASIYVLKINENIKRGIFIIISGHVLHVYIKKNKSLHRFY